MVNPIHETHHLFDMEMLIENLLMYRWQHECVINPEHTITYPGNGGTVVSCTVSYVNKGGGRSYLRMGGLTTFWDVYGDDFGTVERALVALSMSPPPPQVSSVVPTHGRKYETWGV